MTRFGTATGQGKYSLSFETDNHEHYEYMQRAARFCVDGHFFGANLNFQQLQEELTKAKNDCDRLQKEVKMYASVNDSLIEDNEKLKKALDSAQSSMVVCEESYKAQFQELRERGAKYLDDNESLRAKLKHTEELWKATAKTLQTEIDQLNKELIDERKQHSDIAATATDYQCELNRLRTEMKRAERVYNTVMELLEKDGYCTLSIVTKTAFIVAEMELREQNDRG